MVEATIDWLSRLWDWFDNRDIAEHAAAWAIFYGSFWVVQQSFQLAMTSPKPGFEIAAIIAACNAPLTYILPKTVDFYFKLRSQ